MTNGVMHAPEQRLAAAWVCEGVAFEVRREPRQLPRALELHGARDVAGESTGRARAEHGPEAPVDLAPELLQGRHRLVALGGPHSQIPFSGVFDALLGGPAVGVAPGVVEAEFVHDLTLGLVQTVSVRVPWGCVRTCLCGCGCG